MGDAGRALSWDELLASRQARSQREEKRQLAVAMEWRRSGASPPPVPGPGPYSVEEVLGELEAVLADAERLAVERPDLPSRLVVMAGCEGARIRDDQRSHPAGTESLGRVTSIVANWLMTIVYLEEPSDPIAVARAAVGGEQAQLSELLRSAVIGLLDGAIDWDGLDRLYEESARDTRDRKAAGPRAPGGVSLPDAQQVLEEMLGSTSDQAGGRDPQACWEAFVRFASTPVAVDEPMWLDSPEDDGDLLLLEWSRGGRRPDGSARHTIDLVRQLAVRDGSGEAQLEQIHCEFELEAQADTDHGDAGVIWGSVEDVEEWHREAEASPGYQLLMRGTVVDMRVWQDRV